MRLFLIAVLSGISVGAVYVAMLSIGVCLLGSPLVVAAILSLPAAICAGPAVMLTLYKRWQAEPERRH